MTTGDGSPPMLQVSGLDVSYGRTQVLFGLDLEVHEGELVALLGTNGAGKSTLFRALTGLLPVDAGTIHLRGERIDGVPTEELAARGVVMMPGGRSVFPTLTVRENLHLASWLKHADRRAVAGAEERVLALLPRLADRLEVLAGNLSGGEQQMLAIAQALIPDPDLLLIDELSLGLAPSIVGMLTDVVRQAHDTGLTIVVVEQSVNVALQLAERAVFMEKGTFRFSGPTADLLDRPDLLRSVFIDGAGPAAAPRARTTRRRRPLAATGTSVPPVPPVLEVRGLSKRFSGIIALDEVDLEVGADEIVGLIGQNGAGKTTLLDCVCGFVRPDAGRVRLRGEDLTDLPPHERAALGLGRTFQEARLFPTLTTAETVAVARERHVLSRSMVADAFAQPASDLSEEAVAEVVERILDLLHLQPFRDRLIGELSTGTRRIVELASVLASEPSIVVFDEPTGGVAQREAEAIVPLLARVRETTGSSILIIEHDMPVLSSLCDRFYALEIGTVIARGTPADVLADPLVIASYLGTDGGAVARSGPLAGTRR